MNWTIIAILTIGAAALAVLNIYPPWIFDGIYRGHSSIFSTAFMEVDRQRLMIEEGVIVLAAIVIALLVRRKH